MELLEELSKINWLTYIIIALTAFWYYNNSNIFFWTNKGIPYVTPLPFIGSFKLLNFVHNTMHENEEYYFKKLGTLYGHVEGNTPILTIGDPELVHRICIKDFDYFLNRGFLPSGDDINQKMLFSARDNAWKRIRSVVTPTFTSGKMRKMCGLINECIESLLENLTKYAKKGEVMDVSKLFGAFTMDVIASTAFATKIDSHNNPDNPFVKNADGFFTRDLSYILPPARMFPNFFFYLSKSIPALNIFPVKFFKKITSNILRERKNKVYKDGNKKVDFLQLILDSDKDLNKITGETKSEELMLTETEIFAQAIAFFVVGYETTATTIAYCVLEVTKHPEVQKKLLEEVDRVLEETGGKVDYDIVLKMEYLNAVINETLRLFPIGVKIDRDVDKNYKLPNHNITLKRGMKVEFPIYSMHRDSRNFDEPDKFIPERFLPGSSLRFNQQAYLPFGIGPRTCVAMRFAIMEAKMCLASIFRKFTFKVDPKIGVDFELYQAIFLIKPKEVSLVIKERKI